MGDLSHIYIVDSVTRLCFNVDKCIFLSHLVCLCDCVGNSKRPFLSFAFLCLHGQTDQKLVWDVNFADVGLEV